MGKLLIDLLNFIIKGLGAILQLIYTVLPDSPFKVLDNTPIAKYLGYLNYFFPFDEIVSVLELWILAIGAYYIYQIALRWIKAVE